jgi:hypothetical protein
MNSNKDFPDDHQNGVAQSPTVAGEPATSDHPSPDTQKTPVAGTNFPGDQSHINAHAAGVAGEQAAKRDQRRSVAHTANVALGPILADPGLGLAADVLDDLERVHNANANRLRTLTGTDEYGHGLTLDSVDIKRLDALVSALGQAVHQAELNLKRVVRRHPLWDCMRDERGVGEKQFARLLAAVRDPYWNDLHDRPSIVSELWAYCGMHTVNGAAPRRIRGERSNWNSEARQRIWLISDKVVMLNSGRMRDVGGPSKYLKSYDEARAHYADGVHADPCVRCGPKGKPAQPGSPLSAAHQHARGLRAISKAILKDLWIEARRLHDQH